MALSLPSNEEWAALCAEDGVFRLASRFWRGGLVLEIGTQSLALRVDGGVVEAGIPSGTEGLIRYFGDEALWSNLLAATPPPLFNDLAPAIVQGLQVDADPLLQSQYYGAAKRAIELLRPDSGPGDAMRAEAAAPGTFDAPVGRYVHLDLGGHDYRIYFEEAGQGIPLLLQHTAGANGSQWRHLFEYPEITGHFRLIAYDLPFHGKSMPPSLRNWWSEDYRLDAEFLRAVPLALCDVLGLENPVFMGCSVGGLLALDLALHHPERFRAVISLEGALKVPPTGEIPGLWHPAVGNEYKGLLMESLTAPNAPEAYRKETAYLYASTWPRAFQGDLHYYFNDYDLTASAGEIDTSRVGVHILSGEYDYSGSPALGKAAHEAIAGSTWQIMPGMGHFPMTENPERFIEYLLPLLDNIASG
ncbi:MAG: alpha/beta hydrolase [Gammaproteobacteria bacterium]|nr:alpha/beta hydrolase [Gammaproteobacteria bacterium]